MDISEALKRLYAIVDRLETDLIGTEDNSTTDDIRSIRVYLDQIAKAADYNDEKTISISWSIEDVLSVVPHLTNEQAGEVLDYVERNHDATIGVNWDTLTWAANDLFPKPEGENEDDSSTE